MLTSPRQFHANCIYIKDERKEFDLKENGYPSSNSRADRIIRIHEDKVHDQTERARLDIDSGGRSLDSLAIRGWLSTRSDETPRLSRPTYARPLPQILFFSSSFSFPFLLATRSATNLRRLHATVYRLFAFTRTHKQYTDFVLSRRLISHFASHPPRGSILFSDFNCAPVPRKRTIEDP